MSAVVSRDKAFAKLVCHSDELEKLERGYNEVASQLAGLAARAEELSTQVAQSTSERDDLAKKLEEGRCFTKAEVFRLQGELAIPE